MSSVPASFCCLLANAFGFKFSFPISSKLLWRTHQCRVECLYNELQDHRQPVRRHYHTPATWTQTVHTHLTTQMLKRLRIASHKYCNESVLKTQTVQTKTATYIIQLTRSKSSRRAMYPSSCCSGTVRSTGFIRPAN